MNIAVVGGGGLQCCSVLYMGGGGKPSLIVLGPCEDAVVLGDVKWRVLLCYYEDIVISF